MPAATEGVSTYSLAQYTKLYQTLINTVIVLELNYLSAILPMCVVYICHLVANKIIRFEFICPFANECESSKLFETHVQNISTAASPNSLDFISIRSVQNKVLFYVIVYSSVLV